MKADRELFSGFLIIDNSSLSYIIMAEPEQNETREVEYMEALDIYRILGKIFRGQPGREIKIGITDDNGEEYKYSVRSLEELAIVMKEWINSERGLPEIRVVPLSPLFLAHNHL
jgi:hypothetical protein